MPTPTVSFVIPCYKLAHLLSECVNSILSQTYGDFEVLIMDDCSPDHTAEVATSFGDPRVRHIRNERNLGHLRNYNKGIGLSRGDYVWLISADDRLRRPYALERYVRLMQEHPEVGYVFCPGVGLREGVETGVVHTGVVDNYYYGPADKIFKKPDFIATALRKGGGILSPSVMVRKHCYQEISMFPLDMPHQGDTYLWFVWALEYDVAYLSDPMVNYRYHDLNMSRGLFNTAPKIIFTDEVNVLWRIKDRAESKGYRTLANLIEYFIASKYAHSTLFEECDEKYAPWKMTVDECDMALRANATSEAEYGRLRQLFLAIVGGDHSSNDVVSEVTQHRALALRFLWCTRNMLKAGDYASARNVVARIFRFSDWRQIDSSITSSLRMLEAQMYWHEGELARTIAALGRAIMIRPKILGRPIKALLHRSQLA